MVVIITNLNEAWKGESVVLEQYKVHALSWEWIFIFWRSWVENWLEFKEEHSEKCFCLH